MKIRLKNNKKLEVFSLFFFFKIFITVFLNYFFFFL